MEFEWIPMTATLAQALLFHINQNQVTRIVFPTPETGTAFIDRKRWMRGPCKRSGLYQTRAEQCLMTRERKNKVFLSSLLYINFENQDLTFRRLYNKLIFSICYPPSKE